MATVIEEPPDHQLDHVMLKRPVIKLIQDQYHMMLNLQVCLCTPFLFYDVILDIASI